MAAWLPRHRHSGSSEHRSHTEQTVCRYDAYRVAAEWSFADGNLEFGLGERRRVFFPLLGNGIFTSDGESWEHSRSLLRPVFQQNRDVIFAEVAAKAEAFGNCIPSGESVDLQPLFFRFTLDTTTFLLFGQDMKALDHTDTASSDAVASFATAFDEAQDFLARRGRLGGLYWLIDGFRFRRQCKAVHQYIDKAVQAALDARNDVDSKTSYTILGGLLEVTQDPRILRDQCLNVLLAGRDTTACLLSWTL